MLSSTHDRSLISKWTLSSTFFHALALGAILFWNIQQHTPRPKKLLVQAVRIHEFRQPTPQPIVAAIQPKIEPPEEIIAFVEPIVEEPPQLQTLIPRPEVLPEPEAIPVPIPEPKSTPQKAEKAPPLKPQPKQSVKKKIEPVKKAPVEKKVDSQKKKEETARQIQLKAQQKAQEQARQAEKQQNIEAALKSLNQASSKSKSIVAVSSEPVSSVKQVGALHSETIQSISTAGEEEYAPKEARYVAELIHRLKLALKLPEHGEVRVRITLTRSGTVKQLSILKSSSSLNKTAVEQKLKSFTLPAFGMSFPGEESHTFMLILSNAS